MTKEHVFPGWIYPAHCTNIVLIPVGISGMKVQHQIVDKTIHIEILFHGCKVTRFSRIKDRPPTVEHTGVYLCRSSLDHLDPISSNDSEALPIILFPAETLRGPFLLDPLKKVMHPEVESVEIDMNFVLKSFGITHRKAGIAEPLVANIHPKLTHCCRRVNPRISIAPSQNNLVESLGRSVGTKEWET